MCFGFGCCFVVVADYMQIWQDLIIGAQKRSFEILHCLRWERNSYKKCRSDKIVLTLQKNLAFCLICKI